MEFKHFSKLIVDNDTIRGGSREGGSYPFPSGIRLPADQKGQPFVLFCNINFWLTDLQIFKGAFGANIC